MLTSAPSLMSRPSRSDNSVASRSKAIALGEAQIDDQGAQVRPERRALAACRPAAAP